VRGFIRKAAFTTCAGLLSLATASASEIMVTSDITTSTTWQNTDTFNLQNQVYVTNGATLTIEAGTIVASTTNIGGSLAVTRGSKINVMGTATDPVIMTSKADVATWTGGDPKTGTWRQAANEWGNLTVMGKAYISEDAIVANTPVPSASNEGDMEGLQNGPSTDRYGGGDDNDNSGTIQYLSLRYGGKVVSLANELNGMSMGGIGRATDVNHVEIMNNVDDGIETWGGTVNYKYISVWNIGDDSFDIDQGWRGKAQFILIVQGYSLDAGQGSGVGDNCFETDGAEDSDYQPVTTASIWNATVIGQPVDGDHGTAWRDNARIQYHNCIFMDLGEQLVKFDNIDGDGGSGYGHNGTLSWADTWTTDYNMVPAHANDFTTGSYATNYASQTSGKLASITDSMFFRNQNGSAYTEATARGVFGAGNNNVLISGFADEDAPVCAVVRGAAVVKGGKVMLPVTMLDPRPRNEATTSVGSAPSDGFFTPASYRGAFEPASSAAGHWLNGWTASEAFGFTPDATVASNYCTSGTTASGCQAVISATGTASASASTGFFLSTSNQEGNKDGLFIFGTNGRQANSWGNSLSFQCVVAPVKRSAVQSSFGPLAGTNGMCDGGFFQDLNARWAAKPAQNPGAGAVVQAQAWFRDPGSANNVKTAFSNAIEFCVEP